MSKPRLQTFIDLERAVDKVRTGKIRGKNIERVLMKCFTKKILAHTPRTSRASWTRSARGLAVEIVRNIYRFHNLG
jgi:hypothetical protein